MRNPSAAVWHHIVNLYLFKHDGQGLPTQKTGFLTLFALTCLCISIACQTSVVFYSPDLFAQWTLTETCYSIGILYLPGLLAFFAQRAPEVFSLCVFYLVFSVSGALGSLLMPFMGAIAALTSLLIACWSILVYLWFTPGMSNTKVHRSNV